jgi:L-histidine Nalpha-methyltransferase
MIENKKNHTDIDPEHNGLGQSPSMPSLASDTMKGLSSSRKYLLSKYLYDDTGTAIFQEIMKMPGYYLTGCELEIFTTHRENIARSLHGGTDGFDLIELGAGNGLKTRILLRYLLEDGVDFRFVPIDISGKAIDELTFSLQSEMPDLRIEQLTGDYFQMIETAINCGGGKKIILFLGSNIGNFSNSELEIFLGHISESTRPGDKMLIGFDLKKSPAVILDAYHDPYGLTGRFNLNHLIRLNRELDADFDLHRFEHFTQYDPCSGELKSFLISTCKQRVYVGALGQDFMFAEWEPIFMELSRKFDLMYIGKLASKFGFELEGHFTDHRNYFADSLWTKVRI